MGELIVGLQVVRLNLERFQLRVTAEIDGRESGWFAGALVLTEKEGYGRGARSVAFECFADGATQRFASVSIQQL
jgi:hypothetical protein